MEAVTKLKAQTSGTMLDLLRESGEDGSTRTEETGKFRFYCLCHNVLLVVKLNSFI